MYGRRIEYNGYQEKCNDKLGMKELIITISAIIFGVPGAIIFIQLFKTYTMECLYVLSALFSIIFLVWFIHSINKIYRTLKQINDNINKEK